jgi:drug/metabolite transporter (DMT)-like permease
MRRTMSGTTTNAAQPPLPVVSASPRQGFALIALLLGAVCIAMSPIFVRISETGPTATAFWRVALALPVLWPLYAFFGRRVEPDAADASTRWLLVAAGLAFTGDLFFWHFSVKFTSVANSTLLANLAAIFVTLAVWLLFRQKPSRLFLVGLVTALAGVVMLVSTSVAFSRTALLGDAFGVITAMFYAWYLLTVKDLRDRGAGTLRLMAVTTAITALLLLPIALATGEQMLPATGAGWLKLIGIALISHACGQGLIAYALAHLPASFSSVSLLLQPVMAGVFAWLLLGEPLVALQIAGGCVVLVGIYLSRKGSA